MYALYVYCIAMLWHLQISFHKICEVEKLQWLLSLFLIFHIVCDSHCAISCIYLREKKSPSSFRKWRLKCFGLSMTSSCILLIFSGVGTPGSQKYPFERSKLPYFMPYKIPECIRYTWLISSDAAVMASP